MSFGIASVADITAICYLVAEIIKRTPLNNKWLPVICGCLGGILGIISLYVLDNYPANDVLTAFAVGIVSGFSATGINQVGKQLISGNNHGSSDSPSE